MYLKTFDAAPPLLSEEETRWKCMHGFVFQKKNVANTYTILNGSPIHCRARVAGFFLVHGDTDTTAYVSWTSLAVVGTACQSHRRLTT